MGKCNRRRGLKEMSIPVAGSTKSRVEVELFALGLPHKFSSLTAETAADIFRLFDANPGRARQVHGEEFLTKLLDLRSEVEALLSARATAVTQTEDSEAPPDVSGNREQPAKRLSMIGWAKFMHMDVATEYEFLQEMIRDHPWIGGLARSYNCQYPAISAQRLSDAGYNALTALIKDFEFTEETTQRSFQDTAERVVSAAMIEYAQRPH